jgi:hypothetical protein
VESTLDRQREVYPDVLVVELPKKTVPAAVPASSRSSGAAIAEPLVVHLDNDPITQRYIEIVDTESGNRVITVVELLNRANKVPGKGQELYLQKQNEIRDSSVSMVEIDLLRAGRRVLLVAPEQILPSHRTTYQVCVRRGWQSTPAEIYRVPLRERLPVIPIPLRQSDADVPLDLQQILDQCYVNGRYESLDYGIDPVPPLDTADAEWASQILKEKGLR